MSWSLGLPPDLKKKSFQLIDPGRYNLSTEVWWSPHHPFRSSLTQQSSKELATAYTQATKKQWTQPLGFVHALFELAVDVFRRIEDLSDRKAVLAALTSTKAETIVGPIAWGSGPVKNVAFRATSDNPEAAQPPPGGH